MPRSRIELFFLPKAVAIGYTYPSSHAVWSYRARHGAPSFRELVGWRQFSGLKLANFSLQWTIDQETVKASSVSIVKDTIEIEGRDGNMISIISSSASIVEESDHFKYLSLA